MLKTCSVIRNQISTFSPTKKVFRRWIEGRGHICIKHNLCMNIAVLWLRIWAERIINSNHNRKNNSKLWYKPLMFIIKYYHRMSIIVDLLLDFHVSKVRIRLYTLQNILCIRTFVLKIIGKYDSVRCLINELNDKI